MKTVRCSSGAVVFAGCFEHFGLAGLALALSAVSLLGQQPEFRTPLRSPEVESCKGNLNRIFDAIQEYRKVRGTWPGLISDLHPEYISDLSRFLCPASSRGPERTGLLGTSLEDPIPISYRYEFNTKPYQLWAGIASTGREYKLRQMKVVGSNVPIVRCIGHHDLEPNLFLSVRGKIFEHAGSQWETLFINDQIRMEQLLPPAIFWDFAPLPGRFTNNIILRDPATDPNLINLNRHYTSDLRTPWLLGNGGIGLSNLNRGSIQFATIPVRFDVRGVIQLTSTNMLSPFPSRSGEIAVGRKGRFIHLLEGAVQGEPFGRKRSLDAPGTEIGRYEVRFMDGQLLQIPIRYGQDLYASDEPEKDPTAYEAKVAWQWTNKTSRIRLYHQRWQNPRPDTEIASLDFVSNMAEAAPFLIAVTLEP